MSSNSLIAKSVILVSALVGGVVGLFELSDRSFANGSSGAAAGQADDPDTQAGAPTAGSGAVAVPMEGGGTALEREIIGRVAEHLAQMNCREVTVDRVTATATTVPEEETSHGFEGHLLDGAVTLQGRSGPERILLAGSGKGPTGAISAVDMALRGFGEQLKLTEVFDVDCRGE
ncbi:MAG: hypothetical protein ACE369_13935 [Roseovarius sp.]